MRAASGCRSGGGWKSASGRAPVGRRVDGIGRWYRARRGPPASASAQNGPMPVACDDGPAADEGDDQAAADDHDAAHVAHDVAVLLGGARGDRAAAGDRFVRGSPGPVAVACAISVSAAFSSATIWASSVGGAGLLLGGQGRRCGGRRASARSSVAWTRSAAAGHAGRDGWRCRARAWPWVSVGLQEGRDRGRSRGARRARRPPAAEDSTTIRRPDGPVGSVRGGEGPPARMPGSSAGGTSPSISTPPSGPISLLRSSSWPSS